jgi:hypothetical protein
MSNTSRFLQQEIEDLRKSARATTQEDKIVRELLMKEPVETLSSSKVRQTKIESRLRRYRSTMSHVQFGRFTLPQSRRASLMYDNKIPPK